jgi:diguanylate cyclase (GGDEF)-like protein
MQLERTYVGDDRAADRMIVSGMRSYFKVAASPRYRATQRRRIQAAARQGMQLTGVVAVVNTVWLIAIHAEAWSVIIVVNAAVAAFAVTGYVALATAASRRPAVVVFIVLSAVDAATVALALIQPDLGLVAAGYVLLLPIVVALIIPWATKTHTTWLALHLIVVLLYALLGAAPDRPGGRLELLGLTALALFISQIGHVTELRHRVLTFLQVEHIKALNRQARRDRTRLDELNQALAESATTDALTGLGNRTALDAGFKLARSRIARQGERYALAILDLDHFKDINDERGHLAGDEVLRAVAAAIRGRLRPGDTAYRYGGEEFVVLMSVTQPAEALAAAERLRRAIEALQIARRGSASSGVLTVSVGVTTIGPSDLECEDAKWLAPADAALYLAKETGRNRCEAQAQPTASVRPAPQSPAGDPRSKRVPGTPAPV